MSVSAIRNKYYTRDLKKLEDSLQQWWYNMDLLRLYNLWTLFSAPSSMSGDQDCSGTIQTPNFTSFTILSHSTMLHCVVELVIEQYENRFSNTVWSSMDLEFPANVKSVLNPKHQNSSSYVMFDCIFVILLRTSVFTKTFTKITSSVTTCQATYYVLCFYFFINENQFAKWTKW